MTVATVTRRTAVSEHEIEIAGLGKLKGILDEFGLTKKECARNVGGPHKRTLENFREELKAALKSKGVNVLNCTRTVQAEVQAQALPLLELRLRGGSAAVAIATPAVVVLIAENVRPAPMADANRANNRLLLAKVRNANLADLRHIVRSHSLPVKTNVGGRGARTLIDFRRDVVAALF
jgi:hypothetical protein